MRLFSVIIVTLTVLAIVALVPFGSKEKINGVSLVSPPNPINANAITELNELNASWVAIIPYAFTRPNQPSVTYDHERQWWGGNY